MLRFMDLVGFHFPISVSVCTNGKNFFCLSLFVFRFMDLVRFHFQILISKCTNGSNITRALAVYREEGELEMFRIFHAERVQLRT